MKAPRPRNPYAKAVTRLRPHVIANKRYKLTSLTLELEAHDELCLESTLSGIVSLEDSLREADETYRIACQEVADFYKKASKVKK